MRKSFSVIAITFLAGLLGLAVPIAFSSPAFAHASLTSSTPEDGASLDAAPENVVLTFNEELLNELVEVSILDAAGDLVMATEAEQTPPPGTDVIVPWPTDLPAGEYSVAFRVVSEDGHPVTGRVTFDYAQAAEPVEPDEPTLEPSPEQSAEPVSEPTSAEPVTPEATPEQSPELVAAETADEPGNSLIGPLLIVGAVIVGIGVVVSVVMLARSRQ